MALTRMPVPMFGPDGQVLQPSEVLRKKAILVERGSFRPPTVVNIDMLESARTKFETDPAVADREVLVLTELTMANLMAEGDRVDRRDFLARADLLAACGMTVLISDYVAFHRLAAYDRRSGAAATIFTVADELLDAFSCVDFAGVDVAFAVHADLMHPVEIAGHSPAVSQATELLQIAAIQDVDRLVGEICEIEAALRLVAREIY